MVQSGGGGFETPIWVPNHILHSKEIRQSSALIISSFRAVDKFIMIEKYNLYHPSCRPIFRSKSGDPLVMWSCGIDSFVTYCS